MAEVSPLFVLLTVMRKRWELDDDEGAVALAKVAAPYLHGRAVANRAAAGLAEVPDDELEEWGDSEGGGYPGGEGVAGAGPGEP